MNVRIDNKPERPATEVKVAAFTMLKGDRYVERGETGRVIGRFTIVGDMEKCTGDRHNVHFLVVKDGEKGERVACFFMETPVSLIV